MYIWFGCKVHCKISQHQFRVIYKDTKLPENIIDAPFRTGLYSLERSSLDQIQDMLFVF